MIPAEVVYGCLAMVAASVALGRWYLFHPYILLLLVAQS